MICGGGKGGRGSAGGRDRWGLRMTGATANECDFYRVICRNRREKVTAKWWRKCLSLREKGKTKHGSRITVMSDNTYEMPTRLENTSVMWARVPAPAPKK